MTPSEQPVLTTLPHRTVLAVTGADARTFLNGLVSNDLAKVSPEQVIYAALLTPQGKFRCDMLIADAGTGLWLDVEASSAGDLTDVLRRYRLRARVDIAQLGSTHAVAALWGADATATVGLDLQRGAARAYLGGIAFVDPRDAHLGVRLLLPAADVAELGTRMAQAPFGDFDRHRIALAVPDGARDLEIDKAILLENRFEELGGVDFQKGCYVGQELTARTKYRGLVKKQLTVVRMEGDPPAPGTPILQAGREVGTVRSSADGMALALLRLDRAPGTAEPLQAGNTRIFPVG